MGRPGKYETHVLPRLNEVEDWCRNGATNAEIADRLGIAMSSFCEYQKEFLEFSEVLKKTKDFVDGQVENALLKAALFLVGVAFMTIFSWAPTWTGIVYEIITNSFLLVGATFSAINNAVYFLRRKTAVFENQNLLITKRMGITDEYVVNKNGGK